MRKYFNLAIVVLVVCAVIVPLHLYSQAPLIGMNMDLGDAEHYLEIASDAQSVWEIDIFTGQNCALCQGMLRLIGNLEDTSGTTYKVEEHLYYVTASDPRESELGLSKWKELKPKILAYAADAQLGVGNRASLYWKLEPSGFDDIKNLIPFVVVRQINGDTDIIHAAFKSLGVGSPEQISETIAGSGNSEIAASLRAQEQLKVLFDKVVSGADPTGGAEYFQEAALGGMSYKASLAPSDLVERQFWYYNIPLAFVFARDWKGSSHNGEFIVPAFSVSAVTICRDYGNGAFTDLRKNAPVLGDSTRVVLQSQQGCVIPVLTKNMEWYYLWAGTRNDPLEVRTCDPIEVGCRLGRPVSLDGGEAVWEDWQKIAVFVQGQGFVNLFVPAESLVLKGREVIPSPSQNGSVREQASFPPAVGTEMGSVVEASSEEASSVEEVQSEILPTPTFMPLPMEEAPVPTIETLPVATAAPIPMATPVPTEVPLPTSAPALASNVVRGLLKKPSKFLDAASFPFLFDGGQQVSVLLFEDANLGGWSDFSAPFGILWVEVEGPIESGGIEWGKIRRIGFVLAENQMPLEDALEDREKALEQTYSGIDKSAKFVLWDQVEVEGR